MAKGKRKTGSGKVCVFCATNEDNELALGKLLTKQGITVHNFCMLFSSGLPQRGKTDSTGILGFLTADIVKEANRGRKLTCVYCRKKGATIGCTVRHCRRQFHLPCGVNSNSLHQFFDQFCSFCEEHRPQQGMEVVSDRLSFHGTANSTCAICLCPVEARTSNHTLRAPCCKNSWFHRTCVQRQALSAGYFFKCPLCNNKNTFQSEMLKYGIYIPEQDASWELEENAFGELLHRHDKCDAEVCKCPQGRKCNKEGSRWAISLCNLCGSQGCHIGCAKLNFQNPEWECDNCREILNAPSTESVPEPEPIRKGIKRKKEDKKIKTPTKQSFLLRETRGNSKLFKKQSAFAPSSPQPSSMEETEPEEEVSQQELLRDTPSSSSTATSFSSVRKCLLPSVTDDTDTEVDVETVDESITPLSLFGVSTSVTNVVNSDSDSIIQVCSDTDEEVSQLYDGCSDRPEDEDGDSMSLLLTPSTLAPSTPRPVQSSNFCSIPGDHDDDNSDCIIIDDDDDDVGFYASRKFVTKLEESNNAVSNASVDTLSGTTTNQLPCAGEPSCGGVFGNLTVSSCYKSQCSSNAVGNVQQPVTPTHLFQNVANASTPLSDNVEDYKTQINQHETILTSGIGVSTATSPVKGAASLISVSGSQLDGCNNKEVGNMPAASTEESFSVDKGLALKQKFHQPTLSPFFRRIQKTECNVHSSLASEPTAGSASSSDTKTCFKDANLVERYEPPSASLIPKPNSIRPTKGKCKIEFFVQRGRLLSNIVPIVVKKKGKVLPYENEENRNDDSSDTTLHSPLSIAVPGCPTGGEIIPDSPLDVDELQKPQKARKSMRDKTASQAWNNIAVVQSMSS